MKNNTFKYWYLGFIFAFLIIYLFFVFLRKESQYENGKISNAYIYEINQGAVKSGKIVIKYFFTDTWGKKYYGGEDAGLSYDVKKELLNTVFPIIYDTTNPQNNELLIDIKSWKKLNINFPDSLNWLKKYYPDLSF